MECEEQQALAGYWYSVDMSQVVAGSRSVEGGIAKVAGFIPVALFSMLLAVATLPQLLGAKIVGGLNLLGVQIIAIDDFRALGGDTRSWIYVPALLLFLLAWYRVFRAAPSDKAIGRTIAATCALAALVLLSVSYTTPDFGARFTGLSALPFVAFAFLMIPLVWLWQSDARAKYALMASTFCSSALLSAIVYFLVDGRPSPGGLSSMGYLLSESGVAIAVVAVVTAYNVFVRKPVYQRGWVQAAMLLGLSAIAGAIVYSLYVAAVAGTVS